MKTKRKRHEAAFKARVALEALEVVKTIQQIAGEYGVYPVQVSDWKKPLQERMAGVTGTAANVADIAQTHPFPSTDPPPRQTGR